jgi:hypothetical protein
MGVGDGSGAHPAGDTADTLHIWHDEIQRLGLQRLQERKGVAQIFPALDGCMHGSTDFGIPGVIIVAGGLFNPIQSFVVKSAATGNRFRHCEALVEITHDCNPFTQAPFDDTHSCQVLGKIRTSHTHFDGAEGTGSE